MPTSSFVKVADDASGTNVSMFTLDTGRGRQAFAVADTDTDALGARIRIADPTSGEGGLVVRPLRDSRNIKHFVSAATINATTLKASAGKVFKVHILNIAGYLIYVKLFNKSASVPAPAADASLLVATIGCQAGMPRDYEFDDAGGNFSTGIGYVVVKGIADTDVVAVALNDCTVQIEWL
jgi:hypothetical protein